MPTPDAPISMSDAIDRVKARLKPGLWIKHYWIMAPNGVYDGECLTCLHGAAICYGGRFGKELSEKLSAAGYTTVWNDSRTTSLEDVHAALEEMRA